MEIGCISRDNQTIADVTPGDLFCAHNLMMSDSAMADRPTANSKGYDERPQSHL